MSQLKPLLALGLLAAACGQVVTPEYEGKPIATVSGQLSAAPDAALPATVHLAVAWYPAWLAGEGVASAPRAIVTQEVSYRGTFPQRYSFDFYAPPPEAALVAAPPSEGIDARAAIGLLLAYEDLNGNGRLDTLPASGVGGDRVLGTSFDWHMEDAGATEPTGYMLFYVETSSANDPRITEMGFSRGYNLMDAHAPVPLGTPIPIALTAKPTLGFHICEELLGGTPSPAPCGIEIPQPPPPPEEKGNKFGGSIVITDGSASIQAYAFPEQSSGQITDAQVFAGDVPVPYDQENQQYRLEGLPLAAGGTVTMTAKFKDGSEKSYDVKVPTDFTILAPATGAELKAGTAVDVRWTASSGVTAYTIELDTGDFFSSVHRTLMGMLEDRIELDPDWTGPATFSVSAQKFGDKGFPNGFDATVKHQFAVTIVK